MKKVVCLVLFACFAFVVFVVPCFATETTAGSVDWFGGDPTIAYYQYTFTSARKLPVNTTVHIASPVTLPNISPTLSVGDTLSTSAPSSTINAYVNGDFKFGYYGDRSYDFTLFLTESHYTCYDGDFVGTPVYVDSEGFVDSGFSTALEICGDVVHYIVNNTYILVAIGLCVALPLVAWGIGKVKTLIVGY